MASVGAMKFPEKNLLVLASAGSGKTFRLSDRIIGLMAREVEPDFHHLFPFAKKIDLLNRSDTFRI